VGDQAYEISVDVEVSGAAHGGLLLYYSARLFCGMGHDGETLATYRSGQRSFWRESAPAVARIHLRIINDHHIITQYYSADGISWIRTGLRMETSGYNTNTAGELLSLRPALFACGSGEVRFRDFRYRRLA
jgi:xylan 1,4-beta-xylosidase